MPNISNHTMIGDLDWPLNASRGFVSINWVSCFSLLQNSMKVSERSQTDVGSEFQVLETVQDVPLVPKE